MFRIACAVALLGVSGVAAFAQTTPAPAVAPPAAAPAAAAPSPTASTAAPATAAAPVKKPVKTKRQSQYDQCRDVSGRNGYGRNGPSDLCSRLFGR